MAWICGCGKYNADDNRYCGGCGGLFRNTRQAALQDQRPYSAPQASQQPGKFGAFVLIAGGTVVAFVVLIAVSFFLGNHSTSPVTTAHIAGGAVASDDAVQHIGTVPKSGTNPIGSQPDQSQRPNRLDPTEYLVKRSRTLHERININEAIINAPSLAARSRIYCRYKFKFPPLMRTLDDLETQYSQRHAPPSKRADDDLLAEAYRSVEACENPTLDFGPDQGLAQQIAGQIYWPDVILELQAEVVHDQLLAASYDQELVLRGR